MVSSSWRVVHNEKLFDILHHKQYTQWLNQQSRFMSSTCCITTCWSGWIAFSGKPPVTTCLALIVTVSWPLCPPPSPVQLSNNTHVVKNCYNLLKEYMLKLCKPLFNSMISTSRKLLCFCNTYHDSVFCTCWSALFCQCTLLCHPMLTAHVTGKDLAANRNINFYEHEPMSRKLTNSTSSTNLWLHPAHLDHPRNPAHFHRIIPSLSVMTEISHTRTFCIFDLSHPKSIHIRHSAHSFQRTSRSYSHIKTIIVSQTNITTYNLFHTVITVVKFYGYNQCSDILHSYCLTYYIGTQPCLLVT